PPLASTVRVARLGPIADVSVQAGGACWGGRVVDAEKWITGIDGTGVAIVGIQRRSRLTCACPVAELHAVAEIAISTGGSGGDRLLGDCSRFRFAGADRALVSIVRDDGHTRLTSPRPVTRLRTVAQVTIAAAH